MKKKEITILSFVDEDNKGFSVRSDLKLADVETIGMDIGVALASCEDDPVAMASISFLINATTAYLSTIDHTESLDIIAHIMDSSDEIRKLK